MQIRLLRPIQGHKVGLLMDVPDGVGEMWILKRWAERVVITTPVEAMVPQAPRKGGSRRKGAVAV